MRPIWTLTADGTDISARLGEFLVTLSVTDKAGIDSDELTLEIADPRGEIPWPRHGAKLAVALGYAHTGAVAMGEYTVDEVELSNPPRRWAIRARAAELRESGLKVRRTKSWEASTVGKIVSEIAAANGLIGKTAPTLASKPIARLDQTNESDLALLTRLSRQFDAIATVKVGTLLFTPRGTGQTVSGQALPAVTLRPEEVTDWRVSLADRDSYTAVEARWYDRDAAEEVVERAGTPAESGSDSGASSEAGVYRLRKTYTDAESAKTAAAAKLAALARGTAQLSLRLPGRTALAAESPLVLTGFGDGIDGTWILTSVEHRLDGNGYQTACEGERGD
jgi:phage protein D